MSYRNISLIAKCSHGSVGAEVAALKKENALKEKLKLEEAALAKANEGSGIKFPAAA